MRATHFLVRTMDNAKEAKSFDRFKTDDENACMADAINAYFCADLFASGIDFFERQRSLIVRHKKVYPKPHATVLLSLVRFQGHLYKRVFDFIAGSVVQGKWPLQAESTNHLAILDYYSESNGNMHVEPIRLEEGRVTLLYYPHTQVLPFTQWTVEQYLEQADSMRPKLQLNVFHYVRIQ